MEKQSKGKNIIEYALIIALYYVTGGAFSYTNYSVQITTFFIISLCICILGGNIKKVFRPRVFLPWAIMTFFALLVPLFYDDSLSTYIAVVMQISIGMFCAITIPLKNFLQKFINIMVFFAAISLIAFIASAASPEFVKIFPLTEGSGSVDYYNAGVHVFMKIKSYSTLTLMMRNSGICWEPGCYQCFLNIALLFLCERERVEHQKFFYLKMFILVVTILTTVSTAGLIILFIILLIYWKQWFKGLRWGWLLVPVIAYVVLQIYQQLELNVSLQYKLSREFGSEVGFLDRISLNKILYVFSESGLPYFFGMSFKKWLTFDKTLWNSVIHSFLCLGTPFTVLQLIGYWLGGRALIKKGFVLFLVMIMCASTETLFWRVFFSTIAFYGWTNFSNRGKQSDIV